MLASKATLTPSFLAGDGAVLAAITILKDLQPIDALLADFSDLAAFYEMYKDDVEAAVGGLQPYFKRPAPAAVGEL